MKLENKEFKITLTEQEVNAITGMLHESFTVRKGEYEAYRKEKECAAYYDLLSDVRAMRNFFAGLINRSFMGEDA